MGLSRLQSGEHTGGLDDVVRTDRCPGDLGGVPAREGRDLLTVHHDATLDVLDRALEATVGGVVLEHVRHVVVGDEGIVHSNNLHIVACQNDTHHETADASETVDADLDPLGSRRGSSDSPHGKLARDSGGGLGGERLTQGLRGGAHEGSALSARRSGHHLSGGFVVTAGHLGGGDGDHRRAGNGVRSHLRCDGVGTARAVGSG
mmetsp:Transcript_11007/g.18827  ORF Transcript_11007/g.18827 Transcript_11007/m.18827 type:complete len:204 (+) Transcript_11007:857-1468(+)